MRKSLVMLPMLAIVANSGCANQKQGTGEPVDTTLPANTQAIGGLADAPDAQADLNAAANAAIAAVNAAEAENPGPMPDDQSQLSGSPSPDVGPDNATGLTTTPPGVASDGAADTSQPQ